MLTKEQKLNKLYELGFSPAYSGFSAILELVEVWKPNDKICAAYAIAGKRLGISGARVERNIRFSIEKAMSYNHSGMCAFMRNAFDPSRGYPTNHEFIGVLWHYFNAADT